MSALLDGLGSVIGSEIGGLVGSTVKTAEAHATETVANNNGKAVGEKGSAVGFTSSDSKSPVTAINELKKNWTTEGGKEAIKKMDECISSMESIIAKMRETSNKMSQYTVEIKIVPETETRGC